MRKINDKIILVISCLLIFSACETNQEGFQQGYNRATNGMNGRSKAEIDRLTRNGKTLPSAHEMKRAIDPSKDCDACAEQRNRLQLQQRGAEDNWQSFLARSQRRGNIIEGPDGRVELYNGSEKSLPGGPGITVVNKSRYLSSKILDIMPILARAHKAHGHAVRVSHTTGGRHSSNSRHYTGNAIDIDPHPSSKKMTIAKEIKKRLAASGNGCGYFVYVEKTHIHVSYKGVGRTGCPGFSIQ